MATTVGTFPKPVRVDEFGGIKVGNTRVSLDSVVYAFNRGEDANEIQHSFDTLSLAEIHAAISYYLHNKVEVDAYLERGRIEFERLRKLTNSQEPAKSVRERILARRNGQDADWNK